MYVQYPPIAGLEWGMYTILQLIFYCCKGVYSVLPLYGWKGVYIVLLYWLMGSVQCPPALIAWLKGRCTVPSYCMIVWGVYSALLLCGCNGLYSALLLHGCKGVSTVFFYFEVRMCAVSYCMVVRGCRVLSQYTMYLQTSYFSKSNKYTSASSKGLSIPQL